MKQLDRIGKVAVIGFIATLVFLIFSLFSLPSKEYNGSKLAKINNPHEFNEDCYYSNEKDLDSYDLKFKDKALHIYEVKGIQMYYISISLDKDMELKNTDLDRICKEKAVEKYGSDTYGIIYCEVKQESSSNTGSINRSDTIIYGKDLHLDSETRQMITKEAHSLFRYGAVDFIKAVDKNLTSEEPSTIFHDIVTNLMIISLLLTLVIIEKLAMELCLCCRKGIKILI